MTLEEYINKNYKLLKKLYYYSGYTNFQVFCELKYYELN